MAPTSDPQPYTAKDPVDDSCPLLPLDEAAILFFAVLAVGSAIRTNIDLTGISSQTLYIPSPR